MTYFSKTFLLLFGVLGVVGNVWAYSAHQSFGSSCSGSVCLSLLLPSFVSAMTAILAFGVFCVALVGQIIAFRKGVRFSSASRVYAGAVGALVVLYALVGYVWYVR